MPLVYIAVAVTAIIAMRVLFGFFFRHAIIVEYQRGLLYRKGKFVKVLEPGAYWYRRQTTEIKAVDVRLKNVTVPGQEVLSADSVALKVSLAAMFEVNDPATAVNQVENFQEALYMELQTSLRDIVSAAKIDELFEKRAELSKQLMVSTEPKVGRFGLKLHSVSVKDITFPGELKKIFSQVVKAQKEGLASLERARGETAALRNLANAAKMVDDNPSLMQLRMLQSFGEGSGNTLVLGMPAQGTPLPLKPKDEKPKTGEQSSSA